MTSVQDWQDRYEAVFKAAANRPNWKLIAVWNIPALSKP